MADSTLVRVTSAQYTFGLEPVLVRWQLVEPTGLLALLDALLEPGRRLISTTQTALNARAVARGAPVWSDEDVAAELVAWFAAKGITATVVDPNAGGGDDEEPSEEPSEEPDEEPGDDAGEEGSSPNGNP